MFRSGARAVGGSGRTPGGFGSSRPGRGSSFKRCSSASSTAPGSKACRTNIASVFPTKASADYPSTATNPLLSAALTSATLTAVGDLVAQTFEQRESTVKTYDPVRTCRLGSFGLFFYGPVQHYWYAFLNSALPVSRTMPISQIIVPFASKVAANQLILGPITVSSVFAWNMIFTGTFTPAQYAEKWKRDTFRTLKKGWVFWIPAASINFAVVPLRLQVLYMSTCSIVWTTILSAASASGSPAKALPAPAAETKGKKGKAGGGSSSDKKK